jgi:hypothetical protein
MSALPGQFEEVFATMRHDKRHKDATFRMALSSPKAEVTSSNLVGRASATKHLAETEGRDCNALSAGWFTPTNVTSAAFHQARCFQGVSDHSTDIKGR